MMDDDDDLTISRCIMGELFSFTPDIWQEIIESARSEVMTWISEKKRNISNAEYRRLVSFCNSELDNL